MSDPTRAIMNAWPECDICGERTITVIGMRAHRSEHGVLRILRRWVRRQWGKP